MSDTKEYLLVEYSDNWADEMDIDGFWVSTHEDHQKLLESIKEHFKTNKRITYYIGTNEEITYRSAQEAIDTMYTVDITKAEYDTVQKLFGGSRGFTDAFDNIEIEDD